MVALRRSTTPRWGSRLAASIGGLVPRFGRRYVSIRDWVRAVEAEPGGKLRLSNVLLDCCGAPGRCLSVDDVSPLLASTMRYWRQSGGTAWHALVAVLRHKVEEGAGDMFYCQGDRAAPLSDICSRIMTETSFWHEFSRSDSANTPSPASPQFGRVDPSLRARFDELLRAKEGLAYPSKRPIAWVTDGDALRRVRDDPQPAHSPREAAEALSEDLRNKLGLVHLKPESTGEMFDLLELQIPAARFATARTGLRRPTFLDGAESLLYRSRRGEEGWGRAVNLGNGDDGLVEAVHGKITIMGFGQNPIGPVGELQRSPTEKELLQHAPMPWRNGYADRLAQCLRVT